MKSIETKVPTKLHHLYLCLYWHCQ